MNREMKEQRGQPDNRTSSVPPRMEEVFGFKVPTSKFYLHQGHAWAVLENQSQVRVGLDHFSQKILGPADGLKLPEVGKVFYQDHICMALIRQGHKAPFLAPVAPSCAVPSSRSSPAPT